MVVGRTKPRRHVAAEMLSMDDASMACPFLDDLADPVGLLIKTLTERCGVCTFQISHEKKKFKLLSESMCAAIPITVCGRKIIPAKRPSLG